MPGNKSGSSALAEFIKANYGAAAVVEEVPQLEGRTAVFLEDPAAVAKLRLAPPTAGICPDYVFPASARGRYDEELSAPPDAGVLKSLVEQSISGLDAAVPRSGEELSYAVPPTIRMYVTHESRFYNRAEIELECSSWEQLARALGSLLFRQGILRSVIRKGGDGEYRFHQYRPARLPCLEGVDLGLVHPSLQRRELERIKRAMAAQFGGRPLLDSLLFGVVPVRLSLRRHVLLFHFFHLVSDFETSRIIENHFAAYQNGTLPPDGPAPAPYHMFAAELEKMCTPEAAAGFKRTRAYLDYKKAASEFFASYGRKERIIFGKPLRLCAPIRALRAGLRPLNLDLFDIALSVHAKVVSIACSKAAVPVKVLTANRAYKNTRYAYTVGDMHDSLPLVLKPASLPPGAARRAFEAAQKKASEKGWHFHGMKHIDEEVKRFLCTETNLNFLSFLSEEQALAIRSVKEVPFIPYPTLAYFTARELCLTFYNGVPAEKLPEIIKTLPVREAWQIAPEA